MRKTIILSMVLMAAWTGGCTTTSSQGPGVGQNLTPMDSAFSSEPIWKEGDQWTYSDGYGMKVTQGTVEGGGVTTFERTDAKGLWFSRRGLLREHSQDGDTLRKVVFRAPWKNSPPPNQLFPLQAGKKIAFRREFTANKVLHAHLTTWEVLGQELIDVPAVSHPLTCWVLKWTSISVNSDWSGDEKWWYCPEVRNYARLEFRYGNTATSSRVLMTYQLTP